MEVPKGNPLIEDIPMLYEDIDIMHKNLQDGSFTGYIKLTRNSGGDSYIFMLHGGIIYALEYANEAYDATPEWRLKNRARKEQLKVSTYVVSPSLVTVLSQLFAYESVALTKKKISTILKELEQDTYCGVMEVTKNETHYYLLLDEGKPITDNILENYGSIICGLNSINDLTEEGAKGVKVKFFGQRQGEIELKKKQVERELSKFRNLYVVAEKGIFVSDALKVDAMLMDEWSQLEDPGKKINFVIVENDVGNQILYNVQSKRNMGTNKIFVPSKLLKKFETNENETLIVRPKAS